MCASILQRASSYTSTLSCTAPFQVCTLIYFLLNYQIFIFSFIYGISYVVITMYLFIQYTHFVGFPSSQPRAAHQCHFSSWGNVTSRSVLCFTGEESGSWSQSGRHLSTHQDLDFQLSRVQINSILRSNEQVMNVIGVSETGKKPM